MCIKKIETWSGICYLWKWTRAFALSTDSFLWRISQEGSDHKKRPSRSMFPACCSTSQTQATWSWVNPNDWKGIIVLLLPLVMELEVALPSPGGPSVVKGDNPDSDEIPWWLDKCPPPDPSVMWPMIMVPSMMVNKQLLVFKSKTSNQHDQPRASLWLEV